MNNRITQTLCELKTLKILKLTSVYELTSDVYKKLASELPSLMEIHIIDCSHATFSDLTEFVERSTNLKKIVFKRDDWQRPLFTLDMFSSLIKVLKRKQTKETLEVHLNDNDLSNIKNEFEKRSHPIIVACGRRKYHSHFSLGRHLSMIFEKFKSCKFVNINLLETAVFLIIFVYLLHTDFGSPSHW